MFIQVLLNSLISGIIYFLIASGFSIIYSTNRFIYFTHGAVVTLAAYLFYQFFQIWNFNLFFSFLLVLAITTTLGYLINIIFFQPLRSKKSSSTILLLVSIAVMVLVESVILLNFGAKPIDLNLSNNLTLEIFDARISLQQIGILVTTTLVFISLSLF